MNTLSKTYQTASGQLSFEFVYNPMLTALADCDILNMSPLRYGFDSADARSISVYPANITLTVDDFTGDNYTNLKNLYSNYTFTYPFNYYNVFYLLIKLNGEVIFNGILDEVSKNVESKAVEITFIDGINKYKNVSIGNPALLSNLYFSSVVPRKTLGGILGAYAHAYGFGTLQYLTTTIIGQEVITPGYFVGSIEQGDRDVNLELAIRKLITALRSDLQIEYNNEYKFGEANVPIGEMVGIDQVNIRRIMSNLFGRYVVIVKTSGRHNQLAEVNPCAEYQKPDKFEIVYEDDTHIVYYHNWSGNYPTGVNIKKWEKGVDEKTIAGILKILADNTYSYFGLSGANTFFFRHKRHSSQSIGLSGIKYMTKTLTIDKVSEVIVNDYYTDNYGKKGNNYGNDDEKIELKIPLNAFNTQNGVEYRLNYFIGGTEKRVVHFYDAQLQVRDIPQELISIAEWESHKSFRDQYEFELSGIDKDMDKTYSVDFENYQGKFRPITIEKDLLNDNTQMTALEI